MVKKKKKIETKRLPIIHFFVGPLKVGGKLPDAVLVDPRRPSERLSLHRLCNSRPTVLFTGTLSPYYQFIFLSPPPSSSSGSYT